MFMYVYVYVYIYIYIYTFLRTISFPKQSGSIKETGVMYLLGCNNGGGGGNVSKVKRLVVKWVGTRKRLFSGFS